MRECVYCDKTPEKTDWITDVQYLDALSEIHRRLQPQRYLEIGVRRGKSIARSKSRSLGIDPDFEITFAFEGTIKIVKATSDDYFAKTDPKEWLGGPVDMAFIDGMHLVEFALRDFMNVEHHSEKASIIVFDDMLPRNDHEASRESRLPHAWTGDVFRVMDILKKYRPDLHLVLLDTEPTGLLVVFGLDPESRVLDNKIDEALGTFATDEEPVIVPKEILNRDEALAPQDFFNSGLLEWLASRRGKRVPTKKLDAFCEELKSKQASALLSK